MSKANLPAKKDELDAAEQYMKRAGREAKAVEFGNSTGFGRAHEILGMALLSIRNHNRDLRETHRILCLIRDEKLYRFYPADPERACAGGACGKVCKGFHEFLDNWGQPLGMSRGTFRSIEQMSKQLTCAVAHVMLAAGLPRKVFRETLQLGPQDKKALAKLAREYDGDPKEFAEIVYSMVEAASAEKDAELEQARVKADDELNRRLESDRKAEKEAAARKLAEAQRDKAQKEAAEARRTLEAPFFEGDLSEQAKRIEQLDAMFLGHLKYVAKAAQELSGRVAKGKGSDELNQLLLGHVELMTNLCHRCFGRFLLELDPGQEYSPSWAAYTLLISAGRKEDMQAYSEALGLIEQQAKKGRK